MHPFINNLTIVINTLSTGNTGKEWLNNGLKVRLYVGKIPSAIHYSFQPDIYQTNSHLRTQISRKAYSFLLFAENDCIADALFHLTSVGNGNWISPANAPFGGVQARPGCSIDAILFLLHCIESYVEQEGGLLIEVRTAPGFYNQVNHDLLTTCYERSEFQCTKTQMNHHIPVKVLPFEEIIISSEKRRLRKCRRAGFQVITDTVRDTGFIYGFLNKHRKRLGYKLSMTASRLHTLLNTFPNDVHVMMVKDGTCVIAISVIVRVNSHIAYHFLTADDSDYRSFSPAVLLTEAIYNFCQTEGIEMLDLGTSEDHHGRLKEGLVRFKQNIGGIPDNKSEYRKIIS